MKKKIITILIGIYLTSTSITAQALENISILYKINNEIITNIDVKNEAKYLIALNPQLKKMDEQKKIEVAKQSLIKEKIKENELLKFYELNQDDELIEEIMKNGVSVLWFN